MEIIAGLLCIVLFLAIIALVLFIAFCSMATALTIGSVIGLAVGVFFAIKNYLSSIKENITSDPLKITMIIITSVFIITALLYLVGITYFYSNYYS